MEWLTQVIAIILTLLLAAVKSLEYAPNGVSDAELLRRASSGDAAAQSELQRRQLLPTLVSLQYVKEIIISVLIAVVLFSAHAPVVGSLLSILYFFIAYLIAVRGWLAPWVRQIQRKLEPVFLKSAGVLQPFLRFFAPKQAALVEAKLASKSELHTLITSDKQVLSPTERARLIGALEFDTHTIADAMIPRDKIVTVGVNETVGPLLLDRLHTAKHHVFVVIKKDLDHIQGLLYMHDLVPLDPEIKVVKDALRPTVYYVSGEEPLAAIISASLQSGRQLFIVVDNQGNTLGLITLTDALAKLMGTAPPDQNHVATDPKKVHI